MAAWTNDDRIYKSVMVLAMDATKIPSARRHDDISTQEQAEHQIRKLALKHFLKACDAARIDVFDALSTKLTENMLSRTANEADWKRWNKEWRNIDEVTSDRNDSSALLEIGLEDMGAEGRHASRNFSARRRDSGVLYSYKESKTGSERTGSSPVGSQHGLSRESSPKSSPKASPDSRVSSPEKTLTLLERFKSRRSMVKSLFDPIPLVKDENVEFTKCPNGKVFLGICFREETYDANAQSSIFEATNGFQLRLLKITISEFVFRGLGASAERAVGAGTTGAESGTTGSLPFNAADMSPDINRDTSPAKAPKFSGARGSPVVQRGSKTKPGVALVETALGKLDGVPILHVMQDLGLVEEVFALHEPENAVHLPALSMSEAWNFKEVTHVEVRPRKLMHFIAEDEDLVSDHILGTSNAETSDEAPTSNVSESMMGTRNGSSSSTRGNTLEKLVDENILRNRRPTSAPDIRELSAKRPTFLDADPPLCSSFSRNRSAVESPQQRTVSNIKKRLNDAKTIAHRAREYYSFAELVHYVAFMECFSSQILTGPFFFGILTIAAELYFVGTFSGGPDGDYRLDDHNGRAGRKWAEHEKAYAVILILATCAIHLWSLAFAVRLKRKVASVDATDAKVQHLDFWHVWNSNHSDKLEQIIVSRNHPSSIFHPNYNGLYGVQKNLTDVPSTEDIRRMSARNKATLEDQSEHFFRVERRRQLIRNLHRIMVSDGVKKPERNGRLSRAMNLIKSTIKSANRKSGHFTSVLRSFSRGASASSFNENSPTHSPRHRYSKTARNRWLKIRKTFVPSLMHNQFYHQRRNKGKTKMEQLLVRMAEHRARRQVERNMSEDTQVTETTENVLDNIEAYDVHEEFLAREVKGVVKAVVQALERNGKAKDPLMRFLPSSSPVGKQFSSLRGNTSDGPVKVPEESDFAFGDKMDLYSRVFLGKLQVSFGSIVEHRNRTVTRYLFVFLGSILAISAVFYSMTFLLMLTAYFNWIVAVHKGEITEKKFQQSIGGTGIGSDLEAQITEMLLHLMGPEHNRGSGVPRTLGEEVNALIRLRVFLAIPTVLNMLALNYFLKPIFNKFSDFLTRIEGHCNRQAHTRSVILKTSAFRLLNTLVYPVFLLFVAGSVNDCVTNIITTEFINITLLGSFTENVIPRIMVAMNAVGDEACFWTGISPDQIKVDREFELQNSNSAVNRFINIMIRDFGEIMGRESFSTRTFSSGLTTFVFYAKRGVLAWRDLKRKYFAGKRDSAVPRLDTDSTSEPGSEKSEVLAVNGKIYHEKERGSIRRRFSVEGMVSSHSVVSLRILECFHKERTMKLFEEYQEVLESFAFLCFFFSICPMLGVFTFLHMFSEIKSDLWKWRKTQRRVVVTSTQAQVSIMLEAFSTMFEFVGVIAIIVNMLLISVRLGFVPDFGGEDAPTTCHANTNTTITDKSIGNPTNTTSAYSNGQIFMMVLGLEHLLIFLKLYCASYIPHKPESLEVLGEFDAYRHELQVRNKLVL